MKKKFKTEPKTVNAACVESSYGTAPVVPWIVTIVDDLGGAETGPNYSTNEVLEYATSADEACRFAVEDYGLYDYDECYAREATDEEITEREAGIDEWRELPF